ncbi:MAG: hypothetical protein AAFV28_15370 [Cyanobacteria bacterium J06635_13]
MKRRQFFTNTALGAMGNTALSACSDRKDGSQNQSTTNTNTNTQVNLPSVRWRMATSWPKSLQILFEAADLLCQQVNIMTKGHFAVWQSNQRA